MYGQNLAATKIFKIANWGRPDFSKLILNELWNSDIVVIKLFSWTISWNPQWYDSRTFLIIIHCRQKTETFSDAARKFGCCQNYPAETLIIISFRKFNQMNFHLTSFGFAPNTYPTALSLHYAVEHYLGTWHLNFIFYFPK